MEPYQPGHMVFLFVCFLFFLNKCQFGEFGFYPEDTGRLAKAFYPGNDILKAKFRAGIGKLE